MSSRRTNIVTLMLAIMLMTVIMPTPVKAQQSVNVVILGDSNSWLGGDDCTQPKGWTKWFADRLHLTTCRSYARSGATWTNTPTTVSRPDEYSEKLDDNNVIYNQVVRLVRDCDNGIHPEPQLIIISAGTNDAWFRDKRPTAFSESSEEAFADPDAVLARRLPADVLTLASSVRYSCTILSQRFPKARIVLITPMQSTAVADSIIRQTGDIIEACGRKAGAQTVRLDVGSCVKRATELRHKRFTYDGTHTNERGAKCNGYYIADKIKASNGLF